MVKDFNIQRRTTVLSDSVFSAAAVRRRRVVPPIKVTPAQSHQILAAPAKPTQAKPTPAEVVMPEKPSSNNSPSQKPYDVQSKGPLTYFNYYFEDSELTPSKPMAQPKADKSVLFYRGVIGVGVLAATVASGLAIADALHKPDSSKNDKSTDAKPKRTSATTLPNSTSAAPERLAEAGFSKANAPQASQLSSKPELSKPQLSKPELSKLQSTAPRSPNIQQTSAKSLQAQSSVGMPFPKFTETALLNNSSSPSNQFRLPPLPAQSAVAPTRSSVPLNTPPTVRQVSPQQAVGLPAIAPPEIINSANSPVKSPSPGLQAALEAAKAQGVSGNFQPPATPQPAASSPSTAPVIDSAAPNSNDSFNASLNIKNNPAGAAPSLPNNRLPVGGSPSLPNAPAAATEANPNPALVNGNGNGGTSIAPTTTPMPPSTEGARSLNRLSSSSSGQWGNNLAIAPREATNSTVATPTTGLPQGIREYIAFGQKPAEVRRVSLMPLTEKAAVEAVGTKQVGTFTVRQVAAQEYQKEWLASNPNAADPAMALAFPAYGFIDYQRQVIVVLQDKTASLSSAKPSMLNGKVAKS
jgi:hypothetical protein